MQKTKHPARQEKHHTHDTQEQGNARYGGRRANNLYREPGQLEQRQPGPAELLPVRSKERQGQRVQEEIQPGKRREKRNHKARIMQALQYGDENRRQVLREMWPTGRLKGFRRNAGSEEE